MSDAVITDPAANGEAPPGISIRAGQFAGAIFRDALDDEHRCVIWAKGAGSEWCASPEEVDAAVATLGSSRDVYISCCLHRKDAEKPGTRGDASTAVALGAVWADIDVAGDTKKKVYPPDVATALAALDRGIPHRPSMVLHTGGGVHAWWLLDEPIVIESEADRSQAATLVHRFQAGIRAIWKDHGWELDSTHDLARVLRIPSTSNFKYGEPRPVSVLTWDVG